MYIHTEYIYVYCYWVSVAMAVETAGRLRASKYEAVSHVRSRRDMPNMYVAAKDRRSPFTSIKRLASQLRAGSQAKADGFSNSFGASPIGLYKLPETPTLRVSQR
jgi:hypothetical protein